jgi:hypothetical protein
MQKKELLRQFFRQYFDIYCLKNRYKTIARPHCSKNGTISRFFGICGKKWPILEQ